MNSATAKDVSQVSSQGHWENLLGPFLTFNYVQPQAKNLDIMDAMKKKKGNSLQPRYAH